MKPNIMFLAFIATSLIAITIVSVVYAENVTETSITSPVITIDPIGNQTIVVRASTTNEEFMPDLPPRITISGKITTPDGYPVEGATVRTEFYRAYDTKSVTMQSEADGSYRINNAHGFNQKISVEKKGYTNVTKEMTFKQNVNTVDFILEPTTKPASGFTTVLCLVAILGTLLIISRKERTQ